MKKEQYQILDEREHVLKRSARYIGSTKTELELMWVFDDTLGKFINKEVYANKGLNKLFDEILSNSIDEHYRNPEKLNEIIVNIDTNKNIISVKDNGGIPVRKHSEVDVWIPELIFSQLRSGSNFDDTEQRTGAGTHGEGSVLVNIFSKTFNIKTADGINNYDQTFSNNMGDKTEPKITKTDDNYTEIKFTPDLERFGIENLSTVLDCLRMRVYEAAACNSSIKFTLKINGTLDKIKINTFKQFVSLFTSEYFDYEQDGWKVAIGATNTGHHHISFVNSTRTYDGGTHVDMVMNKLLSTLRDHVQKKTKVDIKISDIKNHLFLFVSTIVYNPEWGTQTKEKMVSKKDSFKSEIELPEKLIKKIMKSEIMESILDWVEKKKSADQNKELRELNKKANAKVEKLIDAKGKDRSKCKLFIFEGLSAISATRKLRNAEIVGAYPLRGKFITDIQVSKIKDNVEALGLMQAIGLEVGKEPNNTRYNEICICTDMDHDGNAISSQLINFLATYWPSLFEQKRVLRILTPLYVAIQGKKKELFFSNDELNKFMSKQDINKWEIQQKKGLAALEDAEYDKMLNDPKYEIITLDKDYKLNLEAWFGKDSQLRKNKLSENNKDLN